MKYYVTWGEHQAVLSAGNPAHACILLMKRVFEGDVTSISTGFRVSERGFSEHTDDITFSTHEIIRLQYLAVNNYLDAEEVDVVMRDW